MATTVAFFDMPQGGIRGVASSVERIKGRDRLLAHAYLMEDKTLKASLRLPTTGNMSMDQIRAYAAELIAFVDAVEKA